MKKLTTIFTALVVLIFATAFAPKEETVSAKIKSAFEKTFAAASDVKWKKLNEYYLADFIVSKQDVSAAFNEEGDLISVARNVNLSQVPLSVTLNLQNEYAGYAIDNSAIELTTEGETSYYLNAQNTKRIVTIKASSSGHLSVQKKIKKK